MRVRTTHINHFFALILGIIFLTGCGGKGYQNMTARYNGYFYADLRLGEVMQAIEDSYQYNYNDILKIYPAIDSGVVNGNKGKLEDAFKKASRVIEWHKSSDWVDDSYLIVGKIRHLQAEFPLAVATLQFINQTSKNEDTKHAALITLMRTYMDAMDTTNVEEVINYLDLQDMSEENLINFKITTAYHYQRMGDMQEMTNHLTQVGPFIKNKNERSRINFILGQIYQGNSRNEEALGYYKTSLQGAPPYELDFHANLNMLQVSPFQSNTAITKIRTSYAKLLKDGKNKEYRGKIYYEMGQFEKKQRNYDLALDKYLKAVTVEEPSPRQKALSYLRAGELYYDVYEKFELASAYYDSTVSIMPKDEKGYLEIEKRQGILKDFVTQIKIIQKNDSLLSLAELSPVQLDAYLDIYLDEQDAIRAEEEKEQARLNAATANTGSANAINSTNSNTGATGTWYFYNDQAMSQGEIQFRRQWGDRPLEDNWRRSVKESISSSDPNTVETEDPNLQAEVEEAQVNQSEERKVEKEKLLATIPTTPEAKTALATASQEAYFKLGGIYRFGLEQINTASVTYQTLLEKYPTTTFRLETLFALYSLYRPIDINKSNSYKDMIISEFPDSLTAKLLINPRYLEEKEARDVRLQGIYASAYKAYEEGRYFEADRTIRNALASFEDVDFLPTVQLFAAILKANTENLISYKAALTSFTEDHPEGSLHDEAKKRIAALAPQSSQSVDDEFLYSEDFDQKHSVSVVFNNTTNDPQAVKDAIEIYNQTNFPDQKILVGLVVFDPEKSTSIIFSSFPNKEAAEAYYPKFQKDLNSLGIQIGFNFNNFIISTDNFQTLFNAGKKDVARYLQFYKRFYK